MTNRDTFEFSVNGSCDVWDANYLGWTHDNFKWRLEGRDFSRAIYAEGADGQSQPHCRAVANESRNAMS